MNFKNIKFIFKPSYWVMNYAYDPIWDGIFNYLMDNYSFIPIDSYYAKLGPVKIWIENHPYGSFREGHKNHRASRETILRAEKKLLKDTIEHYKRIYENAEQR